MPELPEVESIRRTLAGRVIGRVVERVDLRRRDIVVGRSGRADLLEGCVIRALERHGKQLAIVARPVVGRAPERVMIVRLGMTGQLFVRGVAAPGSEDGHVHACWMLAGADGSPACELAFRDPRRFGGLFTLASLGLLREEWAALGPDALDAPPADDSALERLWDSDRAIKAALLDQRCLAGVGNIYADESLFLARVHPLTPARRLPVDARCRLLDAVRVILRRAVQEGGSTIRDYRDGLGAQGQFQMRHSVYGRAGKPCVECGGVLRSSRVSQRTTVYCPKCQRRSPHRR